MSGYWNDPEATANAIDADGFMHSGDLASIDGEGFVRITGRAKDMIIRGGENISPREIEEYLYSHPDVTDVAVIDVSDPKLGEAGCAWIVRAPGSAPGPAAVAAHCKGPLAHFKTPASVRYVDPLPLPPPRQAHTPLTRTPD